MSEATEPGPKSKSKRPGKSQKSQHVILHLLLYHFRFKIIVVKMLKVIERTL